MAASKGRELLVEVDLPSTTAATSAELNGMSYDGVKIYTGDAVTQANSAVFKPDGTKFYQIGSRYVFPFTMSTPWDITTATFDGFGAILTVPIAEVHGLAFNADGTKLFFFNWSTNLAFEYRLSTAWVVSTGSYYSSISIAAQDNFMSGIAFNNDGTKMYGVGIENDKVYQYTLSTGWLMSTLSYDGVSFDLDVSSQQTNPYGVNISEDGTKLYICGLTPSSVHQYTLSTPWNIATASYDGVAIDTSSEVSQTKDICFNPDYTKAYVLGFKLSLDQGMYQYSLPNTPIADPGGFSKVGLLRSKTFTLQCSPVDVTDYDSDDWRTFDDGSLGDRSLSVSGSGVLDTIDAALQYLENAVWDGYPVDLKLVLPNGDYYYGTFKVTSFERSGDMLGVVVFSISIESSGVVVLRRYTGADDLLMSTTPPNVYTIQVI